MEDLNPLSGKLYLEALHMTRVAREAYVLICGKYPHPQTIVPGGMSSTITLTVMNEMFIRLAQFFDYSKKLAASGTTSPSSSTRPIPTTARSGARRSNHDRHRHLRSPRRLRRHLRERRRAGASAAGRRRASIVDGKLVTTDLHTINIGLEEFVEHSYYEEWTGSGQRQRFPTDPVGNPLSPYHPWNKVTKPRPQGAELEGEVHLGHGAALGPPVDGGRRLRPALEHRGRPEAAREPASSSRPGTSLKLRLPKGALPEMELEWQVPEVWNAFERNRARAYCTAFTALIALNNWLAAMDRLKLGDTQTSTPFEIPKRGEQRGVGFWGAGRGYLTHHLDARPRRGRQLPDHHALDVERLADAIAWRQPGPYEEAVLNTPLLEETDDPQAVQGHRRAAHHPELRPVHAVHDAHPLGRRRHHARGEHLRVRRRRRRRLACACIVAGVGYRNLRDHSIGVEVADRPRADAWADDVVVEDLSYNPIAVMQRLEDEPPDRRFERAVVVGAVERGDRPPGTVTAYRWDGVLPGDEEIQRAVTEAVTGVIALDNTLVVTRHFGGLPDDVVVVEVEPGVQEFGETFSERGGARRRSRLRARGDHGDRRRRRPRGSHGPRSAVRVPRARGTPRHEGGSSSRRCSGSSTRSSRIPIRRCAPTSPRCSRGSTRSTAPR